VSEERLVSPRLGAAALALFLLGVSLFFFRGALETSDEVQMALTSQSLAESGSFAWEREYMGLRFSGYGAGTPLAGIPAYLLNKILAGVLPDSIGALAPLTNAVLVALIGVLVSLLMAGERRFGAVAVVLVASPFLPASLTFYSEPLSAAGLLACTVGMTRRPLWWLAGVGAAVAVLARPAMFPFVGLVVLFGWKERASGRALVSALLGAGLGVGVSLLQNQLLRGNPFVSGYRGQDFSTPLATGLYGLLVSPERGLLVFWPMVVMPLLAWGALPPAMQSLTRLAGASLALSIALHGIFWTWHGGWTAGPRFLLPAMALAVPPVAWVVAHGNLLSVTRRGLLWLALGWSALMAYIYAAHSPVTWWNVLWGFHREENQWLFLPQLSLWQAWLEGVPLKYAAAHFPTSWRVVHLVLVLGLILPASYPLFLPWRGRLGTDPEVGGRLQDRVPVREWLLGPNPLVFVLLCVWLSSLLALAAGPRGWNVVRSDSATGRLSHLMLEGQSGVFEGWIDYPLASPLILSAKANAVYRVYVNEQIVLEQTEAIPQHLPRVEVPLSPGLHAIRVEVLPKDEATAPLFHLYWTWGGGGRYLAPVGGDWLLSRPLAPHERAASWLRRRQAILFAGLLALLLLLKPLYGALGRSTDAETVIPR
jgi:hypothetical protein